MIAAEPNKQILIVDRDVATVEPLRQKLSDAGFVVRAITDGAAAVAAVAERPPHLVIIDWNMPGRFALDLIQRARRLGCTPSIRLIILSALTAEQDVVTGLDLGVDDYIGKPSPSRCARSSRASPRSCACAITSGSSRRSSAMNWCWTRRPIA